MKKAFFFMLEDKTRNKKKLSLGKVCFFTNESVPFDLQSGYYTHIARIDLTNIAIVDTDGIMITDVDFKKIRKKYKKEGFSGVCIRNCLHVKKPHAHFVTTKYRAYLTELLIVFDRKCIKRIDPTWDPFFRDSVRMVTPVRSIQGTPITD